MQSTVDTSNDVITTPTGEKLLNPNVTQVGPSKVYYY